MLSTSTPANDQGVALRSRWQFNNKRGAIMLMHKPRLICVPDGFFDEKFDLPLLKRKVVVEQVYNCPGFYMYLSNKCWYRPILLCFVLDNALSIHPCTCLPLASEQVTVSLRSNTLLPAEPGASTESTLSIGWSANGSTGVDQQAYREDAVYTPLFRLKSLGRRHWRRDGITPMIEKCVFFLFSFALSFCAPCSRMEMQMGSDLYSMGHT